MWVLLEDDPSAVILGEDILDPYGGAFKATRGLSAHFSDRVFTTPICEASIVGVSVGLALRGMHPVAEIMFGDFVTLAADQIINHAAKYSTMYGQTIFLPLVIRTPMGGGRGYGPTHSQSLEKLFMGIPGLQVVAPSHFHPAGQMLQQAVRNGKPTLFIENKLLYSQPLKTEGEWDGLYRELSEDPDGLPWVFIRNYPSSKKPDVCMIAYGGVSRLLEPLLIQLANDEIWVNVVLPGRISPLAGALAGTLARDHIVECANQSRRVVIIEEGWGDFGWGAEVAARIYNACYKHLAAPIQRVGADLSVIPAARKLEDKVLVSPEKILQAVFEVMK